MVPPIGSIAPVVAYGKLGESTAEALEPGQDRPYRWPDWVENARGR